MNFSSLVIVSELPINIKNTGEILAFFRKPGGTVACMGRKGTGVYNYLSITRLSRRGHSSNSIYETHPWLE
jgi:hypothetical protein